MRRIAILSLAAVAAIVIWWSLDGQRSTVVEQPELIAGRDPRSVNAQADPDTRAVEPVPVDSELLAGDGDAQRAGPLARQVERLRAAARRVQERRDDAEQGGASRASLEVMDAHLERLEQRLGQAEGEAAVLAN